MLPRLAREHALPAEVRGWIATTHRILRAASPKTRFLNSRIGRIGSWACRSTATNSASSTTPWLTDERVEIERAVVYVFHARTAARWRAGVTAWIRPVEGGRARPLRARYLVACDGARSAVRGRLQIPLTRLPPAAARGEQAEVAGPGNRLTPLARA